MKPSVTRFLKLNLEKDVKVCGCCNYASRYEVTIYSKDVTLLKSAAEKILAIKENGIIVPTETVLALACFFNQIASSKIHCRNQKCWTHLGDTCSLWTARKGSQDNTTYMTCSQ
jgi:hypothetical protein